MNHKILNGLFWKLTERGGAQIIQFVIQIILARLLLPKDYGSIALITIFITISNVFVETGFNMAILQKKDFCKADADTAFSVSFILAVILYIGLFFIAPYISSYYNISELTSVLRVLSTTLLLGSLNSIQIAVISKEFRFKSLCVSSMTSVMISGGIGIALAYMKFGVWALVLQQLSQKLIASFLLIFLIDWKPKFRIYKENLHALFRFGSKILLSNLISTVYSNIYGLVIGKIYNPAMLGYYNRADQFPSILAVNISGSMQSVLLPAMSENQDDKEKLKRTLRAVMKNLSFIIIPMMFGIMICAEPIVRILLTDKWLPCVPMLQILCLYYIFTPLQSANLQAINAMGRSDIFLKLEILKRAISTVVIVLSIPFGIYGMLTMMPVMNFINMVINAYPNRKYLHYSYMEQWKDVFPCLTCSILMINVILLFNFLISLPLIFQLCINILLGCITYAAASLMFNRDVFLGLCAMVITFIRRKEN